MSERPLFPPDAPTQGTLPSVTEPAKAKDPAGCAQRAADQLHVEMQHVQSFRKESPSKKALLALKIAIGVFEDRVNNLMVHGAPYDETMKKYEAQIAASKELFWKNLQTSDTHAKTKRPPAA